MSRLRELLVDVDRWDRADRAAQDAVIAEVAVQLATDGFDWIGTHDFVGHQHRPRVEPCSDCGGMGGSPAQSGNSDNPDCSTCENFHEVTIYYDAEVLSRHRVAVFRHRETRLEFVLVPGRMEIAACLVARDPGSLDVAGGTKLRRLTRIEARHVVMRGGAFDLAWDDGVWPDHPFGLRGTNVESLVVSEKRVSWGRRPLRHPDRLAFTIAELEAAQAAALRALADELGPLDKIALPVGCLARTACGTADPPRSEPLTMAFSRDGRWLATASRVGRDLRVWDVHEGRPLCRLELSSTDDTERINSIAFSPDHLRLVAASNVDLEIFELTGQSLARLGAGLPSSRIADSSVAAFPQRVAHWLATGDLLVAELHRDTNDVHLSLIDPERGEEKRASTWKLTKSFYGIGMATSFAKGPGASPGLHAAVTLLDEDALALWDLERWEVVRRLPMGRSTPSHLAIGGDWIFVALIGGEARAYRISTGELVDLEELTSASASKSFSDVAASHDGTRVAWSQVGGVGIAKLGTGKAERCGPETSAPPIAFSPDGSLCATGASHHRTFAAIWPAPR